LWQSFVSNSSMHRCRTLGYSNYSIFHLSDYYIITYNQSAIHKAFMKLFICRPTPLHHFTVTIVINTSKINCHIKQCLPMLFVVDIKGNQFKYLYTTKMILYYYFTLEFSPRALVFSTRASSGPCMLHTYYIVNYLILTPSSTQPSGECYVPY